MVVKARALRLCREDFEVLKVIGRGAFGEVAVVRMRNSERVNHLTICHSFSILEKNFNLFYVVFYKLCGQTFAYFDFLSKFNEAHLQNCVLRGGSICVIQPRENSDCMIASEILLRLKRKK